MKYRLLDFFLQYRSPIFICDISNHCENRETAYSRSDIVVYSVFIAAAQLRNDSTIYHNLVNLFAIFTCYHAVPFLMIFQRKRTLEFSLTLFSRTQINNRALECTNMLMFPLRVPRANPLSMARLAHVHHETSVHLLRIVNMHCAELWLKFFTRPPALGVLRLGGLGRGGGYACWGKSVSCT